MAHFPDAWWHERPLILGHRGASAVAPQNTLAAFRKAAEVGADGVELDVHLSADGVPVVIHDARVDATTDGVGRVAEMPLAQLRALDASGGLLEFAGEPIPTLEEVLAEVGQRLLINIELKSDDATGHLEAAVADVVRRLDLSRRVWFSSFKPYSLFRIRQQIPEVPCGLLYGAGSFLLGVLKPLTPYEALHPAAPFVTRSGVHRAHQRGLRVFAWTVDDSVKAQFLADVGVDGLITNDPAALLRTLAAF